MPEWNGLRKEFKNDNNKGRSVPLRTRWGMISRSDFLRRSESLFFWGFLFWLIGCLSNHHVPTRTARHILKVIFELDSQCWWRYEERTWSVLILSALGRKDEKVRKTQPDTFVVHDGSVSYRSRSYCCLSHNRSFSYVIVQVNLKAAGKKRRRKMSIRCLSPGVGWELETNVVTNQRENYEFIGHLLG